MHIAFPPTHFYVYHVDFIFWLFIFLDLASLMVCICLCICVCICRRWCTAQIHFLGPLSLFSVCAGGLGRLRWIGNDLNSNTFLSTVSLRNMRIKLIANDLNSFLALSNDMSTRVPLSRSDRHGVFVKFFSGVC